MLGFYFSKMFDFILRGIFFLQTHVALNRLGIFLNREELDPKSISHNTIAGVFFSCNIVNACYVLYTSIEVLSLIIIFFIHISERAITHV